MSEDLTKHPERWLDEIEFGLSLLDRVYPLTRHRFTPGMYIREITIPAGVLVTSAIHRTEHPFVISKGIAHVFSEHEGSDILWAPHTGITKPGTRRAVYAETEVIWTTFHATTETDVEKICLEILEPRVNPLLGPGHPALDGWRASLPSPAIP